MWWKVPALLVLGVPLLHRAWLEIQAHPAAIQPRAALPSRERLTARKAEQEKLATDFESVTLPPEAARVILRGSRDKVPAGKYPREVQALVADLNKHVVAIEELCLFAQTYEALEHDPTKEDPCKKDLYVDWLKERRKEIKPLREGLDVLLERSVALSKKAAVQVERRQFPDLAAVRKEVGQLIGDLTAYRIKSDTYVSLRRDLDSHLAEQRAWDKLLKNILGTTGKDELPSEKEVQSSEDLEMIVAHLGRYAELLAETGLSPRFGDLVKKQADLFSKSYLSDRMEEDKKIRFHPLGRDEIYPADEVERSKVFVQLLAKGKVPLSEAEEFNEWTKQPPPRDKVQFYSHATIGQGEWIRPTLKNEAARYYNGKRKSLVIDEDGLRAFLKNCPVQWKNEQEQPKEFQRVNNLLAGMKKYPELFPSK
jgi:hypothetical protein